MIAKMKGFGLKRIIALATAVMLSVTVFGNVTTMRQVEAKDWTKSQVKKEITKTESKPSTTPSTPVKRDFITFEEGYENQYWPAVVILGISSSKDEEDGGWNEFAGWMKRNGFFDKGGKLIGIHELSKKDNVNGENGANMVVLEFSPDTVINIGMRYYYRDNFRWPSDVFCSFNSFYTWYKSGKNLFK